MRSPATQKSKDKVAGVCECCADAFGVADQIRKANLPFAGQHDLGSGSGETCYILRRKSVIVCE